jgi:hypothetical protein
MAAEYTVEEANVQAVKAARYFGTVLARHSRTVIAVEIDGVTIVVAREPDGGKLAAAVEGAAGIFGPDYKVNRLTRTQAETVVPPEPNRGVTMSAAPDEPVDAGAGRDENLVAPAAPGEPVQVVVLVPMYHVPPPEHNQKPGHVHLHVLNDAKLGRRFRKSGESICWKKKGSNQRLPDGETTMCKECVRVAAQNNLEWKL